MTGRGTPQEVTPQEKVWGPACWSFLDMVLRSNFLCLDCVNCCLSLSFGSCGPAGARERRPVSCLMVAGGCETQEPRCPLPSPQTPPRTHVLCAVAWAPHCSSC